MAFPYLNSSGVRLIDAAHILANDQAILDGTAGAHTTITMTGQILESTRDGITAHAGGTQALGVALTAQMNRVSVCATGGDSVLLPTSIAGMSIAVTNAGAASLNVFPVTGEIINALSANAAYATAATKTVVFNCYTAGQWYTLLTA